MIDYLNVGALLVPKEHNHWFADFERGILQRYVKHLDQLANPKTKRKSTRVNSFSELSNQDLGRLRESINRLNRI